MAAGRIPGPLGLHTWALRESEFATGQSLGTRCVFIPGPLGLQSGSRDWPGLVTPPRRTLGPTVHELSAWAQYGVVGLGLGVSHEMLKLRYAHHLSALETVKARALILAPGEIRKATGLDDLGRLLQGLLDGLVAMLLALGASSALGAGVGALVGAFFGLAGAAPGALVGAKLGLEAGLAILSWIGIGFLANSIASGFEEVADLFSAAIREGWAAGDQANGVQRNEHIERAAKALAQAIGVLVRLILQGIAAYLTKNAAIASTRQAANTVRATRNNGSEAVAAQSVANLVSLLKRSKLGEGFARWVELNWQKLIENPKLKGSASAKASTPTPPTITTETLTPSQLRRMKEGRVTPTTRATTKARPLTETEKRSKALREKWSHLSRSQRIALAQKKAEANAYRRLREHDAAVPGAHNLERHGAQLSLQSQYDRAAYGINPTTGKMQKLPPSATRFLSHRDQLNAINRAETIYKVSGDLILAQRPIEFDHVVGSGYRSGLMRPSSPSSVQVSINVRSGKAVSSFPKLE